MLKITNMEECRNIARLFLEIPIEVDTSLGIPIAHHPYTKTTYIVDKHGNLSDITNNKETYEFFHDMISNKINSTEKYTDFLNLIDSTYYMAFLKFTEPYISNEDLSKYLNYSWVSIEFNSTDKNITKSDYIRLFSKADKKILMNEKSYRIYEGLQDNITIYRGVSVDNKASREALSWTLDKDKAEWFSTRFSQTGCVLKARINKKDIFACFMDRGESEVVVNYKKLRDIYKLKDVNRKLRKKQIESRTI